MSNEIAIKVTNLSKLYHLGEHAARAPYKTLRDSLAGIFRFSHRKADGRTSSAAGNAGTSVSPSSSSGSHTPSDSVSLCFNKSASDELWALKDVNFEINRGEVVGIIGRNGAGKSTLLKILSRITDPTEGQAELHGRVGSLLEVGTGFHPELTGRENIYLNGAILGMKKVEITKKFDEIVAFAEVERFIDTPVKFYSSGMYVRLAFAVAAHLEPEILLVDEVLAVGDAAFQKKCLGKMGDVAKQGRTILFVSHNMTAIGQLCRRAIMLHQGNLQNDGEPATVIKDYLFLNTELMNSREWPLDKGPGNEYVRITRIHAQPLTGDLISIDSGIRIEVEYMNYRANRNIDLTLYLQNEMGVLLFQTGIVITRNSDSKTGIYRVTGEIPPHLLNNGRYTGMLVFGEDQRYGRFRLDDAISFDVANTATGRGNNFGTAPGVIRPLISWQTALIA